MCIRTTKKNQMGREDRYSSEKFKLLKGDFKKMR